MYLIMLYNSQSNNLCTLVDASSGRIQQEPVLSPRLHESPSHGDERCHRWEGNRTFEASRQVLLERARLEQLLPGRRLVSRYLDPRHDQSGILWLEHSADLHCRQAAIDLLALTRSHTCLFRAPGSSVPQVWLFRWWTTFRQCNCLNLF